MDRSDPENFEKDLRNALRRENPSDDFEARLAARVARIGHSRSWWSSILAHPQLRWAAVVTLCLLIAGGIVYRREQQLQHARGEAAKQQVMIALRIAGSKMKLARTKVQSLSQR